MANTDCHGYMRPSAVAAGLRQLCAVGLVRDARGENGMLCTDSVHRQLRPPVRGALQHCERADLSTHRGQRAAQRDCCSQALCMRAAEVTAVRRKLSWRGRGAAKQFSGLLPSRRRKVVAVAA